MHGGDSHNPSQTCVSFICNCISQNRQALLVVCEEGNVVELSVPEVDKLDTSHSYQIPDLHMKTYTFRSIKSRLRVSMVLKKSFIQECFNSLILFFS